MYGTFSRVSTWWGIGVGASVVGSAFRPLRLVAPCLVFPNALCLLGQPVSFWFAMCQLLFLTCTTIQYYTACRPFSPGIRSAGLPLVFQFMRVRPSVQMPGCSHVVFWFLPGLQCHLFSSLPLLLTQRKRCEPLRPIHLSFSASSCYRGRGHLVLDWYHCLTLLESLPHLEGGGAID